LRSLLRQDPNIILVGEIRDEETAKVAIRASLTGLLVYSTIHSNSAPGAVTTLYNFNIPPFLLASTVVGVVAQRLIRTICSRCRARHEPDPALLQQAGLPASGSSLDADEPAPEAEAKKKKTKTKAKTKTKTKKKKKGPTVEYWHGRGCDECYGTGYSGRDGIFEILTATQSMRLAISERAPEPEIRRMAIEGGMRTLADAGRAKVLQGATTVEEFIRVLYQ
jgi:type II secretory ATPase GspE/PulE/Tfp pilus assembly ATPase PilB-like protein